MDKKVALTIAGSDPSSGAGIQADLKSFSYLKIHGTTAITCITSQNTKNVGKIFRLPLDIIENQIDLLFEDFKIDSVKTGLLFDKHVIKLISKKISKYNILPIVDPVMISTSGNSLCEDNYIKSFLKHILPKTYILTANIPEANTFSNIDIKSISDMKKTCQEIYDLGPKYVLIKGGHLESSKAIDVLFDGKKFYILNLPMIKNRKAHGSGCSLSAIITGLIALGENPVDAVRKAKYIIWSMINYGYSPGKGSDVLNHFCTKKLPYTLTEKQIKIWKELRKSVDELISFIPSEFIPEVGMNVAYALENANSYKDICSIDGRIYKTKNKITLNKEINFGVSKHIANIIITAMSFDKSMRSAANIKYSKKNLELCKKANFDIGFFDRTNEPSNIKSTMEWGTKQVISKMGRIPDVIYDIGSIGKEPMIRIIAKNPKIVVLKIKKMLNIDIR